MLYIKQYGRQLFNNYLATNIIERDDEFVVSIIAPNVKKDEIKLQAEDGYLTIEVNQKTNSTDEKYIIKEQGAINAQRKFYLGKINEAKIKAKLEDGILTISVPKAEEVKPKYIEIK